MQNYIHDVSSQADPCPPVHVVSIIIIQYLQCLLVFLCNLEALKYSDTTGKQCCHVNDNNYCKNQSNTNTYREVISSRGSKSAGGSTDMVCDIDLNGNSHDKNASMGSA